MWKEAFNVRQYLGICPEELDASKMSGGKDSRRADI
jgi:hypothetical protein